MEAHTKTIAIYNTFDGEELLEGSINCLRKHVDYVLVVAQKVSNCGEEYHGGYNLAKSLKTVDRVIDYEPHINWGGTANEKQKRNLGIDFAKTQGFNYFLLCDNDEYFENFEKAKKEFFDSGKGGSYCPILTYFKRPTLRFENKDNYYVPFIHKLNKDTSTGNSSYGVYVDPTRRINERNLVEINEPMHHFSYVRRDIEMKLRNSSAKNNIDKSHLREDYFNPEVGPGFYVRDFKQKLILTDNIFDIEL